MALIEPVVDLQSLPLFLDHFELGKKQNGNIVQALNQYPLSSDGIDILPLLCFLWTNDNGVRIDQGGQKLWDTIELTKLLFRHEHLKAMNSKQLISSVRMSSALNKLYLMIQLSKSYNRVCVHYACDDVYHILGQRAKGDDLNMHGLVVLCNGGKVKGELNDGVISIGTNDKCVCKNRAPMML